ncbi:MAG: sulfurtransferase [Candidatus Eremiobacteraeota bacterium]|nr:sulfurtransferase [Candidatus Eremiobacteraeota bacterium]
MPGSPFVDVEWVRARLEDPSIRIVDARSMPHGAAVAGALSGAEQYAAGHLPGAVALDYAHDLSDPATPYATRVAPPELFASVLGKSGIGDASTIVAYDDGDVPYAARFLWMCRFYGHDAAFVMAGGFKAWRAAGYPVTTERPRHAPSTFTVRIRPELRATRDDVLAVALGRSDVQLLETQRDKTYALRDRGIPNAVRLSGNRLLEDDRGGLPAPRATLNALVDEAGLDRAKRTIVTCGSGVSASGSYLALIEAGFTNLAVYDGSWLEWSHDGLPTVPKH